VSSILPKTNKNNLADILNLISRKFGDVNKLT